MSIKKNIGAIIQKSLSGLGYRLQKIERPTDSIDCYTTVKNLLKHYQPVHVCDIGANDGMWIKALHNQYNQFQSVVLIEPQSKLIDDLERVEIGNVKKYILNKGVSDQNGTLVLNGNNPCASFLDLNYNIDNSIMMLSEEKQTVDVLTLDTIYQQNKFPQPDLIKLDVQGFENSVLNGAVETLKNVKCIVVELSFQEFYIGQPSIDTLLKILNDHHFTLIEIGYIWRQDYNSEKRILQFDGIFLKE